MILYNSLINKITQAFNINNNPMPIFEYLDLSCFHITDLLKTAIEHINANGFCIVRAHNNHGSDILAQALSDLFGKPMVQNKIGITEMPIRPIKNGERYINSNSFQPLHTDNGYSLYTPDIISMRCIKQASQGGESLIVCVNDLLKYLKEKYLSDISLLYEKDAITYLLKSHSSKKFILEKSKDGKDQISLTVFADSFIGKNKKVEELFLAIIEFVNNMKNQKQFFLKAHDFLIIDNRSVLHGRKPFSGERLLMRTWYRY